MLNSFLVIFWSVHAFANGWVSSGGELFKDAKNPWFVKSTTQVSYCIKVEDDGFSAPLTDIENAISDGLQYWKAEFARTPNELDGGFDLGTQVFQKMDCNPNVDVQFLFGYKTLSPEQIAYLKNPKKFIGVTVRTDYDLKILKAKGFIFFSSDFGINAYENDGQLAERAWSRPRILRYAILHELGHMFGIPHMGSGLMSEVFLNQILNKALVDTYEKLPVDSFLRPSTELELCFPEDAMSFSGKWFGAGPNQNCIGLSNTETRTWKVFTRSNRLSVKVDLGEIRNVTLNSMDQRGRPVSILELTEQQTVFSQQEALFRSYMMGPMLIEMGMNGVYIPNATKKPHSVYISITPSSLGIQALNGTKIEPVFIFNSPISILLIKGPQP